MPDVNYCDNQQLYKKVGPDLADQLYPGFNAFIFVFGQKGSQKTYTMNCSSLDVGVIPRILNEIVLSSIIAMMELISSNISMTFMEIYIEKIKDLLALVDE